MPLIHRLHIFLFCLASFIDINESASSIFGSIEHDFTTVKYSNTTLDSKSFLNACKQYVKIYDTLGGGTKLVKRDILSNIKKIEELTAHNGTSNIFEIITKEVLHIKTQQPLKVQRPKADKSGTSLRKLSPVHYFG